MKLWAANENCPLDTINIRERIDTLGLNQRLSKKKIATAEAMARIIAGNLIVKIDTPKTENMAACSRWRGRFATAKLDRSEKSNRSVMPTMSISPWVKPPGNKRLAMTK